jgi:hypothetical protein
MPPRSRNGWQAATWSKATTPSRRASGVTLHLANSGGKSHLHFLGRHPSEGDVPPSDVGSEARRGSCPRGSGHRATVSQTVQGCSEQTHATQWPKARTPMTASAQAQRSDRNASSFLEGMCSVTAVRLDSSAPHDYQRPETTGQPADASTSIQNPPSTSLAKQGESLIPRYGQDQRLRWSGPVWSPPPESNRRPHPYHRWSAPSGDNAAPRSAL